MVRYSPSVKTITACRSCCSKKLDPILSLGQLYISDFVDTDFFKKEKAPLKLVLCRECGLFQLRNTVSAEKLYRHYWYRSGINNTMRKELKNIAKKAMGVSGLKSGDFVLDIGSNDSTLLLSYTMKGITRVGFEPSRNLMRQARTGDLAIVNNFFNYKDWRRNFGDARAKIITAIAMFYDLDDPNEFIADIVKVLDHNGVFIIQMSYLPLMLSQNAYDNICHEHLCYYSLTSLEGILERHGLEVFDVVLNDVNGGSFRVFVHYKGDLRRVTKHVFRLRDSEKNLKLFDRKMYDAFASRVRFLRKKLTDFIKREVQKGKKVYVYGASTKGNTLLQFCRLDFRLIKAAADRSPFKWGKRTVGTSIPIIPEAQARKEKPDYFLVLPWHFLKEFVQREKHFLNSGGKFIVPLSQFKVIGKNQSV